MSISRQQRRAQERQAAKKATRPGPRAAPAAGAATTGVLRERVVDIELYRTVFDDDPDETYVSWGAEWGLRDDSVGVEDSNENLTDLVADILEDLRSWTDRYSLRLEWDLGGDPPPGGTVADAVAEWNVTLPTVLP